MSDYRPGGVGHLFARLFSGPILAIPDEDWHVQFSVGVDHPRYYSFSATIDNGKSVMVTKFPGVEAHLDGYEEVMDSYRLLIGGFVPDGRAGEEPAVKKLYETLERRLSRRITIYVDEEKRRAAEEKEKEKQSLPPAHPPSFYGLPGR